jgi:hypothetical protein
MAYDFPNAPTLGQVYQGWVWDGVAWQQQGATASSAVRYDTAQGLTANQQAQARANIDVTQKNYILNGAMMVSQENGSTSSTAAGYYAVDQFTSAMAGTTGVFSSQQVASVTPAGSPNRLRVTVTSADAAVAAGDIVFFYTKIEGLRAADLNFGTAAAKTITVQFGVRAPAGTYCIAFYNAASRGYVAQYVISAGEDNTDVVKSVTLTGDITGTWAKDSTTGLEVRWCLMAGTTYQTAANTWLATQVWGTASQFNFMGTGGNVFELFDVSLTEGSAAPPFQVPDYASELLTCQRYYWQGRALALKGVVLNGVGPASLTMSLHVPMRAIPTLTIPAGATIDLLDGAAGGSGSANGITTNNSTLDEIVFTPALAGGSNFNTAGRPVFVSYPSAGILKANARL